MSQPRIGRMLALIAATGLAAAPLPGQAPAVTCKTVYTLLPGEEFLSAESCLLLSATKDSVVVVVGKGKDPDMQLFLIKDGKKQGPFRKVNDVLNLIDACKEGPAGSQCGEYRPDSPGELEGLETVEDGASSYVKFKGKSFGPYVQIGNLTILPDKSGAYFIGMEANAAWLVGTDGRKVRLGGVPEGLKISPSGKNAMVLCQGSMSLADLQKADPSKMPQMMEDMQKKFLFSIDGRKFGPFRESFDDYWFAAVSDQIFYKADGQVFANGGPLGKTPSFGPCEFYPSADGKAWAIFTYDALIFSDGQKSPFPLAVTSYPQGGRTVVKWVSLQNGKDIILCQRTI